MAFIPANPDEGEKYGTDLEESISILKEYLYKTDMVACRMFGHFVSQVSSRAYQLRYKNMLLQKDLDKALSPKGAVFNDGNSIYWYNGHIYYNTKKVI
jgi:hypothetical protein